MSRFILLKFCIFTTLYSADYIVTLPITASLGRYLEFALSDNFDNFANRLLWNIYHIPQGISSWPPIQYKDHLTRIGNPMVEIRWSYDCLISTMGFPILVRWHIYIESGLRILRLIEKRAGSMPSMYFLLLVQANFLNIKPGILWNCQLFAIICSNTCPIII